MPVPFRVEISQRDIAMDQLPTRTLGSIDIAIFKLDGTEHVCAMVCECEEFIDGHTQIICRPTLDYWSPGDGPGKAIETLDERIKHAT